MVPIASSLASKLNVQSKIDYPFKTDGKIIIYQACNESIGCSMKSQLEQYIWSTLHAKNKQLSSSRNQVLLTHIQQSSILKKRILLGHVHLDVSANTPWFKFQMPKFRSLLEKYWKQHIPDQSTFRKHYLPSCYEETLENIRGNKVDALYGLL
jgi:hypothetical protein